MLGYLILDRYLNMGGIFRIFSKRTAPFLPLSGKSQIILAANEVEEGNSQKALRRIESLTECLIFIMHRNKGNEGKADPYKERMQFELNRLYNELKNYLKLKNG